jgi:hypothetical protein
MTYEDTGHEVVLPPGNDRLVVEHAGAPRVGEMEREEGFDDELAAMMRWVGPNRDVDPLEN